MSNSVQVPIQQSAVSILIAAMADVGMDEQEWMKLVEMDAMIAAEEIWGREGKSRWEETAARARGGKGRVVGAARRRNRKRRDS